MGHFGPISILMIEKTSSNTGHNNFIENWAELVAAVNSTFGRTMGHSQGQGQGQGQGEGLGMGQLDGRLPSSGVQVVSIVPSAISIPDQIAMIHQADILVTLWGGPYVYIVSV